MPREDGDIQQSSFVFLSSNSTFPNGKVFQKPEKYLEKIFEKRLHFPSQKKKKRQKQKKRKRAARRA